MSRLLPSPACRSIATSLLGLLLMAVTGCKEQSDGVGVEPEEKFEGILVTYENGVGGGTIGDASDDWRPIPELQVSFGAAYPNPASSRTEILYSLAEASHVRIWLESAPGVLDTVLIEGVYEAGKYRTKVDVAGKSPGIYRAYMSARRDRINAPTYTSYGDIMVGR